jgi:cyanophycinase
MSKANRQQPERPADTVNDCPVPNGILLVIGGHENKQDQAERKVQEALGNPREILETFIRLTGKEAPVIEVVTTASSVGDEYFRDYKEAFTSLGVKQVGHIHHESRSEVPDDQLIARVQAADGIFFSGGNQLKLTSIYGGTAFLTAIKQRYIHERLVLAGTSAGAMAFSTPMIYAGSKSVQQLVGEIRITTGLEFLKDVCIDTHFVERGRFVRMAQVVASNPTCIGIGIEEDAALIVRNGTQAEVIGSGVVIIIEGFGITDSNILDFGSGDRVFIRDLNIQILARGNQYQIPRNNPPHI